MPVSELLELPVELSAAPVDDESPVDELPLVDSGTVVTGGPDENPDNPAVSPQIATARAARIGARVIVPRIDPAGAAVIHPGPLWCFMHCHRLIGGVSRKETL
jgi:hypothetical protein